MFLQKVYKHSRWLFVGMILFIIAQLFINLKRGMVFSPFYHYGMYSEVMNVRENYTVFEVEVNGRKLQAKDFSPQRWDKIIVPLNFYAGIKQSNTLYNADIKRLMNTLHVSSNEKNFIQNCDSSNFNKWYTGYLESMLHKKADAFKIHSYVYQFNSGHLRAIGSITPLAQTCN